MTQAVTSIVAVGLNTSYPPDPHTQQSCLCSALQHMAAAHGYYPYEISIQVNLRKVSQKRSSPQKDK